MLARLRLVIPTGDLGSHFNPLCTCISFSVFVFHLSYKFMVPSPFSLCLLMLDPWIQLVKISWLYLSNSSLLDFIIISSGFVFSIRALCGLDSEKNCVHGSDSTQSAGREISFFFKEVSTGQFPSSFFSHYGKTCSFMLKLMLFLGIMSSSSNDTSPLVRARWSFRLRSWVHYPLVTCVTYQNFFCCFQKKDKMILCWLKFMLYLLMFGSFAICHRIIWKVSLSNPQW